MDSYYGMQDEEAAARDAHDIDSSAFNVAETASDVLASRSLPELISYSNNLHSDTRNLDREMQDLVYNNYNKFIAATDTIRRMKDGVGDMETKMSGLVKDMRSMGGSSELVNGRLQENRAKIEKLVGVKRLLLKLEFLFELPVRLKRAMELDAHGQAVSYYTMVSGVLAKYDHIPSLHRIRVEADTLMHGLRGELRGVLRDAAAAGGAPGRHGAPSSVPASRVVEAIRLLVALDEPRPALRAAFLAFQRARLTAALAHHAAKYAPVTPGATAAQQQAAAAAAAASVVSSSGADGSSLMSSRAAAFYSAAQAASRGPGGAAASSATAAPVSGARPRAPVSAYVFLQSLNRGFLDAFKVACELYSEMFESASASGSSGSGPSSEEDAKAAHDELVAFAKDVFGEYYGLVKRQLSLPPPLPRTGVAGGGEDDGAAGGKDGGAGAAAGKKGAKGGKGKKGAAAAADSSSLPSPLRGASSASAGEGFDSDEAEASRAKAAALAAAAALEGGDASGSGSGDSGEGRYTPVTDALKLLLTDIRGAARHVKEARLGDRAHEVTEAVLRAQLDGLFADVRVDVVRSLAALHEAAAAVSEVERQRSVRAAAAAGGADVRDATAASPRAGHSDGAIVSLPAANPYTSIMTAASDRVRSAPESVKPPGSLAPAYDWLAAVGASLAAAGEAASLDVSDRIDEALYQAKPLVLNGMRLLPDLARAFSSLVHGQVLGLLYWTASAWEALGDPLHPARSECAAVTVEADLGLDREAAAAARQRKGGSGGGSMRTAGGGDKASAAKRRVPVNFAAAEADGGLGGGALGGGGGAPRDPCFLLLLAVLCGHFATHGVARALSTMLQSLPTRGDLQAMGLGGALEGGGDADSYGSMMDVPDIIKKTQGAGRELLRRFVFVHGCRLGALVRRAQTTLDDGGWLAHPEPREVRLGIGLLLEDIAATRKLVAATLGEWDAPAAAAAARALGIGTALAAAASGAEGGAEAVPHPTAALPSLSAGFRAGAGQSPAAVAARRTGLVVGAAGVSAAFGSLGSGPSGFGGGRGGGGAGFGAMDVDKLFRSDPSPSGGGPGGPGSGGPGSSSGAAPSRLVLGYVDYSPESVTSALLRVTVKALVEWTRGLTLGAGGFQQLQADIAVLHMALPFLVNAPSAAAAGLAPPSHAGGHGHTSSAGGTLSASSSSASPSFDPYASCGPLEELLNEAAVSAGERCVDPRPLEVSILFSLATAKLARLNVAI